MDSINKQKFIAVEQQSAKCREAVGSGEFAEIVEFVTRGIAEPDKSNSLCDLGIEGVIFSLNFGSHACGVVQYKVVVVERQCLQ